MYNLDGIYDSQITMMEFRLQYNATVTLLSRCPRNRPPLFNCQAVVKGQADGAPTREPEQLQPGVSRSLLVTKVYAYLALTELAVFRLTEAIGKKCC